MQVDQEVCDGWLTLALLLNMICVNTQVLCFPILAFMEAQRELTEANRKLDRISNIDTLTGATNRRNLNDMIHVGISKYIQEGTPFSIILCDLDFFKQINDRHGHLIGDFVLKAVAKLLQDSVRPEDIVIRYGGEEFIILLSATNQLETFNIAERLRLEIEYVKLSHPDLPDYLQITSSFGVADLNKHLISFQDLIKVADQALY